MSEPDYTSYIESKVLHEMRERIDKLEAELALAKDNQQLADKLCAAAARLPDDDTLYEETVSLKAKLEKARDFLIELRDHTDDHCEDFGLLAGNCLKEIGK